MGWWCWLKKCDLYRSDHLLSTGISAHWLLLQFSSHRLRLKFLSWKRLETWILKNNNNKKKKPRAHLVLRHEGKKTLQFKDHVEHSIRAVGLQQLHNVGVLEHVTDTGLALQVWKRKKCGQSVFEYRYRWSWGIKNNHLESSHISTALTDTDLTLRFRNTRHLGQRCPTRNPQAKNK